VAEATVDPRVNGGVACPSHGSPKGHGGRNRRVWNQQRTEAGDEAGRASYLDGQAADKRRKLGNE
jgi:hypothetical protein